MLDKRLILGVYDDGDKLLNAVTKLRQKGVKVLDCFTPFPVHNLDRAMGIRRTNLTVGAFLCGLTGFLSGLLLQFYMMTDHLGTFKSWPMNIGGKPLDYAVIPSMVPVIFELTILFTAFGIGILFFYRARMIHGKVADILDPRQTDDLMLLAIDADTLHLDRSSLNGILSDSGAVEIRLHNLEAADTPAVHAQAQPASHSDEKELSEADKQSRVDLLLQRLGAAGEGRRDDLKLINGVGPAYEAQLNSIGIYTFEQVSKLDAESIQAIEELTKYFPGRIEREDWKGQASKLMNE